MSTSAIQKAPPAAAISAAVATSQIFPTLASASLFGGVAATPAACILPVPGAKRLEGKRFEVRASGICTTAVATYTVQATLFAAIVPPTGAASLVPANWTAVAVGAATVVAASAGWLIEAELLLDSTSGKLIGNFDSNVGGTYVAKAALTAAITGINGATEPALAFAVGLTFSTASAGNNATLTDFVLDA